MSATLVMCCRYAIAIVLTVIGLRLCLHVAAGLSAPGVESTPVVLALQTLLLPCAFLAGAYLLVFRRYRRTAGVVLVIGVAIWGLPLLKHLMRS